MKITCQACAAKYTIADEKVLGKIVKIRCKKCGATIVVNGNDPSANAGAAGVEPPRAFDYVAQGAHGDSWTVNVADGDQRTLTDGEIADAYHAGIVDDETFCWKDGMTDWLPIREIEQLAAACSATRAVVNHPSTVPPGDGVTKIQEAGPGLFAASPPPATYAAPRPGAMGNGARMAPAQAAAARRTGGRAPAADLFGGAAQAGSEEDVMTSAPVGMPEAHEDAAKLTGQRNENSVLFSLNALTSNAPGGGGGGGGGRPMPASSEASGLIDIRQLGAQIGIGDNKKQSRIDDIMNLAGGGAFSPSLSAPVMSAPPIEEYAPQPEAMATGQLPAASKSKALIFGAIGAGVVVVAGAIGIAVMVMGKSDKADGDKTASSATSTSTAPSTSAAMTAPSTTPSDTTAAAPAPTDTSTAAATAATTTATAATAKPSTTATAAATTTATIKPATTTTAAAAPTATAAAAAAAGGTDQPFNMGEAKARLAGIAGSVQGCKKGDVSGSGRVVVTFAPGGNVASAVVSGPPFAGTPTGACVASRFRGAHVPAFAGSPFSVSKSFTIN